MHRNLLPACLAMILVWVSAGCAPVAGTESSSSQQPSGPSLTILTASLQSVRVGTAFTREITAVRGTAPFRWDMFNLDELPQGVTLEASDTATVRLSGIPAMGSEGDYTLSMLVIDAQNAIAEKEIVLKIEASLLDVTGAENIADIGPAEFFSIDLEVTGGTEPYAWSTDGLPDWLDVLPLNKAFLMSGTAPEPSVTTTVSFAITVSDDATPANTFTLPISFAIVIPDLVLETRHATLDAHFESGYYIRHFKDGIEPYTFRTTPITTPTWIQFDDAHGFFYGDPSSATWSPGTFKFTLEVTDSSTPAKMLSTEISIDLFPPVVATGGALRDGEEGKEYQAMPAATGGWLADGIPGMAYWWGFDGGNLPPVLVDWGGLVYSTKLPYGSAGTYTFRLSAADSNASVGIAEYTITIHPAPLGIYEPDSPDLIDAVVGQSYSVGLEGGGIRPLTWSLDSGPDWLEIDAASGVLSNSRALTDTDVDSYSLTVRLKDSSSSGQEEVRSYNVKVVLADPDISDNQLPHAYVGMPYWSRLLVKKGTGSGSYQWSATGLPAWLALDTLSGELSGTPPAEGTHSITFQVDDLTSSTSDEVGLELMVLPTPQAGDSIIIAGTGYKKGPRGEISDSAVFDDLTDGIPNNNLGRWDIGLDGPAVLAAFNVPSGIAVDSHGNLFVTDVKHYAIHKIHADATTGKVSPYSRIETVFGGETSEDVGLINPAAEFIGAFSMYGLAVDDNDTVYFADAFSGQVYKISAPDYTATPVGPSLGGLVDFFASGIAVERDGSAVYACGSHSQNIYKIDTATGTKTILGIIPEPEIFPGGTDHTGIAVDSQHNVYVCNAASNEDKAPSAPPYTAPGVYRIAPNGSWSAFAVTGTPSGLVVGDNLGGIAIDSADNVYFADMTQNPNAVHNLIKVTQSGTVTTTALVAVPHLSDIALAFSADDTLFYLYGMGWRGDGDGYIRMRIK